MHVSGLSEPDAQPANSEFLDAEKSWDDPESVCKEGERPHVDVDVSQLQAGEEPEAEDSDSVVESNYENRPRTSTSSLPSSVFSVASCPSRPCTPASSVLSRNVRTPSSRILQGSTGAAYRELKAWLILQGLGHLQKGLTQTDIVGMQDLVQAPVGTLEELGSRSDWAPEDIIALARALRDLRQTRVIHHHRPPPAANQTSSGSAPSVADPSPQNNLERVRSRPSTVASARSAGWMPGSGSRPGTAGSSTLVLSRPGTAASLQHQLRIRRAAAAHADPQCFSDSQSASAHVPVLRDPVPGAAGPIKQVSFHSRLAAPRAGQRHAEPAQEAPRGRLAMPQGPSWRNLKVAKQEREKEAQWAKDLVLGRVAKGR